MAQPKNINNAILGVLESIDAKLDATEKSSAKLNTNLEGMAKTGVVSEKEYESFAKFFGEMAKGLTSMVKAMDKVSDKTGERFGKFIGKIGDSIAQFFEKTDAKQVTAFSLLLNALGKNTLSFAIQMVLAIPFLLIAPIGAALFGLTIRVLLWAMGSASNASKKSAQGIAAILGMGKGILLFSLSMILYILVAPIVIIGAILFGLTIRLLLWVMGASGKNSKETAKGIGSILDLAKGILLFALAMIVVVILFPVLLLGALIFALTLIIINLGLKLISTKKARKGVMNLVILGLSILLFALVISFFDKMVTWNALFKTAITLAGLGLIMWVIGKQSKSIMKGATAMVVAAVPILLIAAAMMMWKSANPSWEDIGKLAATVAVIGVIGLLAGLGPIPGFIMAGSAAMIVAGAAILLIAAAMFVWAAAKVTWKDVGTLGATVAMIGIEMGLLGLASPFIFAGAAAMAFAAIPLILITGSLAVFKKINWKNKDGDMLVSALDSVVAGFLGGRMPGGFLAAIKFAVKAAARTALLFITIPPFLLAGAALVPITWSLKKFKDAKWKPSDSIALEGVMAALIKAFSLPSDYVRQRKLGIYTSPWRLKLGIWALKDAGSTMASLAEGVQAFANLTVPIYGWVENDKGGGELKIIEKRQMSNSDFDKAAYGMATVIGAIAKPLAAVGRLEQGASSGNPILDAIFAGNFVSLGVSALRNAGDTIVGLAEGVQSFANLSIPVYGLVDFTDENGNKNKKLMVIDRKPMTMGDIALASLNISMVIGVIAKALAKVGKTEAESSGWFSGGYVSKGSKALAGVGNNIKAIADVVANYAKLEHTPMEVVGAGTKDQKLVPGKPIKITRGEIMAAANTISDVLGVMVKKMAYIGEMESKGGWFFKNGYVAKGVKAIAGMGANIGAVADAVFKFATGTFQPMEVVKGKLVPAGSPQKVTRPMLMAAANMIGDLIRSFGNKLRDFGWWTQQGKNWFYYTQGIVALEKSNDAITLAVGMVKRVTKHPVEKYIQTVISINALFTGIYKIFNHENAPDVARSSWYFTQFSINMRTISAESRNIISAGKGMQIMANASTKWVSNINKLNGKKANQARWLVESMAKPNAWKGAKSISVSTVRLKEQINGLDMERLKILNSLMCALATLGSTDVGLDKLGESIGDGMKEGFELLAEYLAELLEQGAGGSGGGMLDGAMNAVGIGAAPAGKPGKSAPVAAPVAAPAGGDMAKKITQALQNTVLTVRVQGGGI